MFRNLKFHHIGVATKNIEKEYQILKKLGYKKCSDYFEDPIQKIRGLFIECKNQPRLELIEGIGNENPIKLHLSRGNKFYHFAYEVSNINEVYNFFLENYQAKTLVPITDATYFKKICFVLLPNMMIIELVQVFD